jgi:hypothetical protein
MLEHDDRIRGHPGCRDFAMTYRASPESVSRDLLASGRSSFTLRGFLTRLPGASRLLPPGLNLKRLLNWLQAVEPGRLAHSQGFFALPLPPLLVTLFLDAGIAAAVVVIAARLPSAVNRACALYPPVGQLALKECAQPSSLAASPIVRLGDRVTLPERPRASHLQKRHGDTSPREPGLRFTTALQNRRPYLAN